MLLCKCLPSSSVRLARLHELRHVLLPSRPVIQILPASVAYRAGRRLFHGEPTAYYDARVEDIRNIGIIAHVDAGKTTTTERMLFHSGMIKHLGNVDHGDTVTDFLPMERNRGITIQSAAITFHWPPQADCAPDTHPKTINLIDTPGHQDFRFEVDRCMPVLDGAVCIMDSVKGVEAHTERVWASAQQFRIPRLMYVNKLDRDGASFHRSVTEVATRLKAWPLVCQIPWWEKDKFVGVIDVIEQVGIRWRSSGAKATYAAEKLKEALLESNPALVEEMERARAELLEVLLGRDEWLLSQSNYSDSALIKQSIRRLISSGDGRFVPVFAGSSLRNIGVDPLLDAVVDYLPNANERPPVEISFDHGKSTLDEVIKDNETNQRPTKKGAAHGRHVGIAAVASVFKVACDFKSHNQTKEMLSFVRVYHGTLPRGADLWNSTRHTAEKPQTIVQISADKTHLISHLGTGQIGALKGLKDAKTGDTLLFLTGPGHKSNDSPLRMLQVRPAEIPHPVAFITMAPASQTGLKNLEAALEKLSREDPSLRYSYDDKTELFTVSGMGRLHLEVSLDRLKNVYKVGATVYGIEVEYKECLLGKTEPQRYVFDQVVNSRAGKAACTVTMAPREDWSTDHDTVHVDEDNLITIQFIENPESPVNFDREKIRHELLNGASAALRMGPRLRRPMHGCAVSIEYDPATDYFGTGTPSSHTVKAAYNAVKACLKDAHTKAQIGVLEPVMRVDITCPEAGADAIQHDITSSRGGLVLEVSDNTHGGADPVTGAIMTDSEGGDIHAEDVYVPPDPYESIQSLRDPKKGAARMLEIKAVVPLKEMLDYDSRLRSQTGGRHTLNMTLDTFQRVTGPREKALG